MVRIVNSPKRTILIFKDYAVTDRSTVNVRVVRQTDPNYVKNLEKDTFFS